ncbi:hypothetical protein [Vibrio rotiferianus]|uniref:hypothetical protein n=1 Tax=Vibrio rotiferianus TaxID=190895 RepID=UPI001ED979ED|nr:hypothetical protein [Vibrio rotiferianus]
MVHVFRLLLLLSLSLFSGQMLAAQNYQYSEAQHTYSEKFSKLTHVIKTPCCAWKAHDSWSQEGYFRHLKRELLGLLPYRRSSSNDGKPVSSISPNYHLLVAFSPPALLEIALKAVPLPNNADLFASNGGHHLPGWKQANLLYVFKHSRDL